MMQLLRVTPMLRMLPGVGPRKFGARLYLLASTQRARIVPVLLGKEEPEPSLLCLQPANRRWLHSLVVSLHGQCQIKLSRSILLYDTDFRDNTIDQLCGRHIE